MVNTIFIFILFNYIFYHEWDSVFLSKINFVKNTNIFLDKMATNVNILPAEWLTLPQMALFSVKNKIKNGYIFHAL